MTKTPVHRFFSGSAWIEGNALAQLDFLTQTIPNIVALAAMPDLHPGKYGPVGMGLLAPGLHPTLVGSDIGCGMGLFRTDLKLKKLRTDRAAERLKGLDEPWDGDRRGRMEAAGLAPTPYDFGLGSIGSGNHFCEVQAVHEMRDEAACREAGIDPERVHLLVHSGSRALGASILDALVRAEAGPLAPDSEEGRRYLAAHDHAVAWARLNRAIIAERAGEALRGAVEPVADRPHNFLEPRGAASSTARGPRPPTGGWCRSPARGRPSPISCGRGSMRLRTRSPASPMAPAASTTGARCTAASSGCARCARGSSATRSAGSWSARTAIC
ncbi:Release factor H-coupled RctB family protein [Methylobacterium sp. AMS5]|nr:Release factor H-coupled RctB family protein [Methylobacterium sp. AMS5]